MFPISSEALYICGFAAFFATCAVSFLGVPRRRWLLFLPFGLLLALAVLLLPYSKVGWHAFAQILAIGLLAVLLVCAAGWSVALHYAFKWWLPRWQAFRYLLAVLPAVAVAGAAVISQTVPRSACSEGPLLLTLGPHSFAVPRSREVMVRVVQSDPKDKRQLYYSQHRDHKSDLQSLCKLSQNGIKPIAITELLATSEPFQSSATHFPGDRRIMILLDSHFTHDMYGGSYHDINNLPEIALQDGALTRGDADNGAVCRARTAYRYCSVWTRLSAGARISAHNEPNRGRADAEVLTDLESAMETLLQEISP